MPVSRSIALWHSHTPCKQGNLVQYYFQILFWFSLSQKSSRFANTFFILNKNSSMQILFCQLWTPMIQKHPSYFYIFSPCNPWTQHLQLLVCPPWRRPATCVPDVSASLQPMSMPRFPGKAKSRWRYLLVQPPPVQTWSTKHPPFRTPSRRQ